MKKKHLLWIFLPLLAIMLTAEMCSSKDDDDDESSESTTSIVGTWVGYQGYDGYTAIFNNDKTGVYMEPDVYYNYAIDFIWKMTGSNEGRIYWVDDGEIYYYEGDGAVKFKVTGNKMMIYEYDDGYYYSGGEWELMCILVKEK